MKVSEVMSTSLITVKPDTRLEEVHELFESRGFHHLPVLEGGRLIGIVSKQDYLQVRSALSYNWNGTVATDKFYSNFNTRDIMTEYPMHLSPDDSIGLAADIFLANKFHALPILDDEDLVGIVTTHDLLAFAFKSPVEAIEDNN